MKKFYDYIQKENIIYKEDYIDENIKGLCIKLPNSKTAIILNNSLIENKIERNCILAEELGHYYCDALYSPFCKDQTIIDRNEYRAKKWAFKSIIGKKLNQNIKKYKNMLKYEVAEEIGVTEDMLDMAYDYYKRNEAL